MSEIDCLLKIFTTYGIDTGTSRVLDIGCGNGKFTLELAAVFDEVVAIDASKEVVEKVTKLSQKRKLKNVEVLQIDAKDLHTLGDNKFNVIIARNSLHFIPNVEKFYDDIKFLLRSHGVFLKISNPLFDLVFPGDAFKSSLVDSELKSFTESRFRDELEEYWQTYVKENFVKYCDPFRTYKETFVGEMQEFEMKTSREIHLLDLKDHIKEITVVNNYISQHGIEEFESVYQEFLKNISFLLDLEPCDLYFEDITLMRKDVYYVEVQANKE